MLKTGMHKAAEVVRLELVRFRTGKATTALLDGIRVDDYGSPQQLSRSEMSGYLDVPTLHRAAVRKEHGGAGLKSHSRRKPGSEPDQDADIVRIPIPALNEERRREL